MNAIGRTELEIKLMAELEKMPDLIAKAVENAYIDGFRAGCHGDGFWGGPNENWESSDIKAELDKGMEVFSEKG